MRIGNPGYMDAEDLVENTVLAVEDPTPYHSDCGRGTDHRQEKDSAEAAFEFYSGIEQYRYQQRQKDAYRYCENAEQ